VVFAVVDFVGTMVASGLGMLRRGLKWLGWSLAGPERDEDPRVILLVQLDHLGDGIISTVMLPALRRRYPAASIEMLVGEWNRELFEAVPEVDRVHVSRVNRFARGNRFGWLLATLWWGWKLRSRKVDLAIDVRGEFPLALVLWLCGARRRLGWDAGGGGFLLTDSPRYVPNRPEAESRLALLAELGIRPDDEPWRPVVQPSEEARRRAGQWWDYLREKTPANGPRIVIHVGAGTEAKRWPAEHWRELLGWMIVQLRAQVVLVGSKADRIIARHILGPQPCEGVADWTGQLCLVELAAVLERADLMVGADSGPAHLAAAVGAPVVALFSGTNNPRQWQPSGESVCVVRHEVSCSPCHREQCPLADHPCMAELRPEQVAKAVEQVISSSVGKESDDDRSVASQRDGNR
jgi:lipopolysaccharide heptosyltransferase II